MSGDGTPPIVGCSCALVTPGYYLSANGADPAIRDAQRAASGNHRVRTVTLPRNHRRMRVAALYDIHGNLPALEAVLEDIRQAAVDHVVVGGDVLPGPMPRETLTRLLELDLPVQFIHGNGDRVVVAQMAGNDVSEVPEQHREVIRWTAQQLRPEHERTLAGWPATCVVEIRGLGDVLFCHATPRNDTECFTRMTSEERLAPVFGGVTVPLVVCGHTHMQFDRTVGSVPSCECRQRGNAVCAATGCALATAWSRRSAATHGLRSRGRC